jgi:hypothetical protein
VDTVVPQVSPAAPILFVGYLSSIFGELEKAVPGIRGLSFADDIAWWAKEKMRKRWRQSWPRRQRHHWTG